MIGIVWNPTKVDEDALRGDAERIFAGEELHWWETSADDPGRSMASDALAAGCDTIVAVGGDGTVRIVAEELAKSESTSGVRLGIVPQGTGNLLARNLGIPLGSVSAALQRIADGNDREIDMGWVRTDNNDDETGFLVMVGFGLDAHMLAETDDDLKARAGWLAYAEAMGRAVAAAEVVDVTLQIDDSDAEELSGHTLLIGNCGMIQGGFTLLPDAEPDDGVLNLLLVSAANAGQWFQTLRAMVWDNGIRRVLLGGRGASPARNDHTHYAEGEQIEVQLAAPQLFQIDGEEAGTVNSLAARIQPAALRVFC